MKNDSSSALLPRRQFLVLGSAAVAAAAATSLSADVVRSALVIEDPAPRLSVGYTDVKLDALNDPSVTPRLTAASKLRAGDRSLAGGVRVKVHGLVRPEAVKHAQARLAVDAMYRVEGQEAAVPFLAWSYARIQQKALVSSSNPFLVPVSAKQPLSLAVSSSTGNAVGVDVMLQATVNLAVSEGRRENKLRTGLYFVAVCPAGMKAPDWASVHAFASGNGPLPALRQVTLLGAQPVPFDYVVFSVDRA